MQPNHKKRWLIVICIGILLTISACSSPQSAIETGSPAAQTNSDWRMDLIKWELTSDLLGSQSIQQYNGDISNIQYHDEPSRGYTFLLVELTIQKQKTGPSSFTWDDLAIVDGNGIKYSRLPNDTFLENYNFPRIKSTDMTIGKNEGYICFEIPEDAASGKLDLVYESNDAVIRINLK